MNRALTDTGGDAVVVSQFTLHASTRKGNRPSFLRAARPEISEPLYQDFCRALEQELAKPVSRGRFGADMRIALVNEGPVTIAIDTKNRE
jgi:D-tyrosyl-tRNA(Tyr) deacylase